MSSIQNLCGRNFENFLQDSDFQQGFRHLLLRDTRVERIFLSSTYSVFPFLAFLIILFSYATEVLQLNNISYLLRS